MKNEYEVRGDVTAIFLKRRDGAIFETLIDTVDLAVVSAARNWTAVWDRKTKTYRAQGRIESNLVSLHRLLLGNPQGKVVDHRNHDTLDNRRSVNLRALTNAENMQNRNGLDAKNTSGYRGVVWHSKTGKWRAQIELHGKPKHLGLFTDPKEAAKVVEDKRKEVMPYATN